MSRAIGKKSRTRQRILDAAARLFASQGYEATSIEAVMGACGLTRGGFYAHFRSKAELCREALGAGAPPPAPWRFLATEVASRQPEVRAAYAQALRAINRQLQEAGDDAWATTALLVGAMAITLTVDDAELKDQVARACERAVAPL